MMSERAPLAPPRFPDMPEIPGVVLASGHCGIRTPGRNDLLIASLPEAATAAVRLTRSRTASPAVLWCKRVRRHRRARGLVVNSGNANAFTGQPGRAAVRATAEAVADVLGCKPHEVYVASTGVIGEPLPLPEIVKAVPTIAAGGGEAGWEAAAEAIMTTDTFPKGACAETSIDGRRVTIGGIAKGSGMIAPDMGTMLAFVFTDADLPGHVLDHLLGPLTDRTFNSITVDSDTSTSDTCALFATRAAPAETPIESAGDARLDAFREALEGVMADLARQIVRDGEGATKLVTVTVRDATRQAHARAVAFSIANSPLVKTAVAGEDANWGRIVMAVGKAGVPVRAERVGISIGGIPVARGGSVVPGYDEAPVAHHMQGSEISLEVSLGAGTADATVWTCDLTHGYIAINADYRS
ncbi:MAG: bifunctional glutamate N-acetyltransferase/amino-acid acetyltransferase ArgJ [Rhodospirillales bacterium]|nr:bifunctional glutamate N-acetyltransferase/amino-acid acetyltransferase ArgJ [Rhodospirillales bacterium]MDE0710718.1 bifunctional glutamate N-acetyltransferase/amino-acid acetyltransferase ArgJ [Rhodospirillales bacterium]